MTNRTTLVDHLEKSGVDLDQPMAAITTVPPTDDGGDPIVWDCRIGRALVGLPDSVAGTDDAKGFDDRFDICIYWTDPTGKGTVMIYSILNKGTLLYSEHGGLIISNHDGNILLTQDSDMMLVAERFIAEAQSAIMV